METGKNFIGGFCKSVKSFCALPTEIRTFNENQIRNPTWITNAQAYAATAGFLAGVAVLAYVYRGLEEHYTPLQVFAAPIATNIASGIYEFVRNKVSERKKSKQDLEKISQEAEK